MVPDKVIYTDGHDVKVTDSVFQVKKESYRLKGITKHGLQRIKPRRVPGIALVLLGLVIGLIGYFTSLPSKYVSNFYVDDVFISANAATIWLGGIMMITGVLVLGLLKERYAVRIETAEGEKNVIVSYQQEYVQQIILALNRALHFKKAPSRLA